MGHHVVESTQEKEGKGKDNMHYITIVSILRKPQYKVFNDTKLGERI